MLLGSGDHRGLGGGVQQHGEKLLWASAAYNLNKGEEEGMHLEEVDPVLGCSSSGSAEYGTLASG